MLSFYDCDIAAVGSGTGWPVPRDASELLPVMDRYGIAKALVYDRGATEAGVFDDFDGVLKLCAGSPRLTPTVPAAPPATGEGPSPDELVGIILAKHIGGVRIWPKLHNFNFNAKVFGKLFERLERHRIPVFYQSMAMSDHPWEHKSDWEGIRDAATAFPDLPLVVVYTGMLEGRKLMPTLESCPNVLMDLTHATYQMVEFVTERLGAGRLVLASHYPVYDPGLQTNWIAYSGIDAAAKQAIAFDNVARLVEDIK